LTALSKDKSDNTRSDYVIRTTIYGLSVASWMTIWRSMTLRTP